MSAVVSMNAHRARRHLKPYDGPAAVRVEVTPQPGVVFLIIAFSDGTEHGVAMAPEGAEALAANLTTHARTARETEGRTP